MIKVTTQVSYENAPISVKELIDSREQARKNKDFVLSDQIRLRIEELGYLIQDSKDGYTLHVAGDSEKQVQGSYLVLFGSGEIAPSSVSIYRELFLSLGKRNIRIALITTPAGFQPNASVVYQEIKDYLISSLPDFNLEVDLVYANTNEDANTEKIVSLLDSADVIFTGPGSPTYCVRTLRDSLLLDRLIQKLESGTTLILASAATIAFSKHALPVYEIYKVGEPLHWVDGLDLYTKIWTSTSIIPHFNNKEGGKELDTSHCFIGKERFTRLRSLLSGSEKFIGIDEHTAHIIDLNKDVESTKGKGAVRSL